MLSRIDTRVRRMFGPSCRRHFSLHVTEPSGERKSFSQETGQRSLPTAASGIGQGRQNCRCPQVKTPSHSTAKFAQNTARDHEVKCEFREIMVDPQTRVRMADAEPSRPRQAGGPPFAASTTCLARLIFPASQ